MLTVLKQSHSQCFHGLLLILAFAIIITTRPVHSCLFILRPKEADQRKDDGSVVDVEEQIMDDKRIQGISEQAEEDELSFSKKLSWGHQGYRAHVEENVERSDSFVQDQIIVAPEIMSMIFGQLDLRSLKICRRVCKCWLLEAQPHLERRAVVRLQDVGCSARMSAFTRSRQKRPLRTFAEPFTGLEVELITDSRRSSYHRILKQLRGILRVRIVLTQFSAGNVPLQLALPLILECSFSLECLKLEYNEWKQQITMDPIPELNFPKLRHINLIFTCFPYGQSSNNFPSIVASIVNNSPNLDTFRSRCCSSRGMQLGSELLLKVNIKSVKSLILSGHSFNKAAVDLFNSVRFSRLEYLKLEKSFSPSSLEEMAAFHHGILATMRNSADTLKKLDLPIYAHPEFRKLLVETGFPLCPNVEELTIPCFPDSWPRIVSNSFPAVHVLNASLVDLTLPADFGSNVPPFFGVKTLRGICVALFESKNERLLKFFKQFPELERICLDGTTLLDCCKLKATGDPRFENILKSAKHLELNENILPGYVSSLGALRGIESITLVSSNTLISYIPFQDLPRLKVLQFPWGAGLDLDKLLEIARRVKRVIVSNCCSVPRLQDQKSKELLDTFFDAAPNVECGCGLDLMHIPEW